MKLSQDDFLTAIAYMQTIVEYEPDGVQVPYNLPYGVVPGQGEWKVKPLNENDWDEYQWNPPEFLSHKGSEANCAAKPTWKSLVEWATTVEREEAIQRLRTSCERRITRGYGELTHQDENHQRLKAMEPGADDDLQRRITAGHAERDRLLTRYHEIKTWLRTLTDLDTLKNLTFETDDYWTTTWTPPA